MAKLISTIWALLLNTFGISIFQTCFANSMEDEEGESVMSGPPVTSFLFAAGAYTIIVKFDLFPQSLKKPNDKVLFVYEFLVAAFLLEFAVACIWAPIDVLILTTIPRIYSEIQCFWSNGDPGEVTDTNRAPLTLLSYAIAVSFFFLALHVTNSVDFEFLSECGFSEFYAHAKSQLVSRLQSELPSKQRVHCGRKGCRCRSSCTRCTSRNCRQC